MSRPKDPRIPIDPMKLAPPPWVDPAHEPLPLDEWPVELCRLLRRNGIETWERLTAMSEAQLMCLPRCGAQSIFALRKLMRAAGRSLRNWTTDEYDKVRPHAPKWTLNDRDCVPSCYGQNQARIIKSTPGVYFIKSGNLIKIGLASDVRSRLKGIRGMNPHVSPLAYIPCPVEDLAKRERELHKLFAEHRESGEWFREHDALGQFVAEKAEPWPT